MVRARTILMEGGFPIDYGWRQSTSENVHMIEDKYGGKEAPSDDTEPASKRDEVQWVRAHRRGRGGPFKESRRSNFNCYRCKRTGHGWINCPDRVCNKCGNKGHDPADPHCPLSYEEKKSQSRYGARRGVYLLNETDKEETINAVTGNTFGDREGSVTLEIMIEGNKKAALLDTGARPSIIDIRTLAQLGLEDKLVK